MWSLQRTENPQKLVRSQHSPPYTSVTQLGRGRGLRIRVLRVQLPSLVPQLWWYSYIGSTVHCDCIRKGSNPLYHPIYIYGLTERHCATNAVMRVRLLLDIPLSAGRLIIFYVTLKTQRSNYR